MSEALAADATEVVVDCSVIVNAILGIVNAEAVSQMGARKLAAPTLLDYEVLSTLRRLVAHKRLGASEASEALVLFGEMSFERHGPEPMRPRMWALRHAITAYDAAYVALAEALGVPLLTADLRLAATAEKWCTVVRC